jgi:thymidylate synthase (FAD)
MGNVRLIAISKPVIDEVPGTAELLAFCARVSSTANQLNHETGGKLIRSLVTRKEWSPLEMISLTFEIETTRDVARQILRHRSFSFQEFSQRYAAVVEPPVFREARLQDHKDRQNSIDTDDAELATLWETKQRLFAEYAANTYQWALDRGIAKEVARAVLPEGMTPSRLYVQGTLRSWFHYCELRCDRKTQKEHRAIAQAVASIIADELPDLADLFSWGE